jgi:hypothetical protein
MICHIDSPNETVPFVARSIWNSTHDRAYFNRALSNSTVFDLKSIDRLAISMQKALVETGNDLRYSLAAQYQRS